MGPLLWTGSSAARLAEHLCNAGHPVSERTVNRLLHELGYSLQANRKTLEGAQHADRDASTSTGRCAPSRPCGNRRRVCLHRPATPTRPNPCATTCRLLITPKIGNYFAPTLSMYSVGCQTYPPSLRCCEVHGGPRAKGRGPCRSSQRRASA